MILRDLILSKLQEKFPDEKIEITESKGELSFLFDKKNVVEVCRILKNDPELLFVHCADITAIDWARRKLRYTMVYHLFSIHNNIRIRLKADIDESDLNIDSVSSIWRTANWHERETYDMYGISFNNHPDLRRMYLPEEFEYHPLRKDFPLMGIPGSLTLPKK
jgi:NADH-quinone oxidoreductase subunit C